MATEGGASRSFVTTNRPKTAEEIFDKRQSVCGMDTLKRRISKMRRPAWLTWAKDPYGGKSGTGTEAAVYPPEENMREVKQFAATKHIDVIW